MKKLFRMAADRNSVDNYGRPQVSHWHTRAVPARPTFFGDVAVPVRITDSENLSNSPVDVACHHLLS